MKVKALFISDVHLGARGVKAKELLEVLGTYKMDYFRIWQKQSFLERKRVVVRVVFGLC